MRRLLEAALVATVAVAGCQAVVPSPQPSRVIDGPFTLAITSTKLEYLADEPIHVSATLTYTGPDTSVTVGHAQPMIGFGVERLLNGNVRPAWYQSCGLTELRRGEPLTVPFAKMGATVSPDPSFNAFMADPVLRLPPGVWHVYAEAAFSEGDCKPGRDIRAEIVITVVR